MMTHDHQNFPSDIFTIMEAVNAQVVIGKITLSYHRSYKICLIGCGQPLIVLFICMYACNADSTI